MGNESRHEATLFAVDAGGSVTRLLTGTEPRSASRTELPSINPSSVGQEAALDALGATIAEIGKAAKSSGTFPEVAGIIASAAVSISTLAYWKAMIMAATAQAGLTGRILLTNDVVPLLLGKPLWGSGAVMVAGTGSCVLGAAGGLAVRVGGVEYLGSDEGSAFSLGRAGLVAAVRARDGRGEKTSILDRMERTSSLKIDELARRLAELPYPRIAVARFAPEVTWAWREDNDPVAATIIHGAVGELGLMARRAIQQLPQHAARSWALTGGVIAGCPAYGQRVRDVISRAVGDDASITMVPDCLDAAMSMLASVGSSAVLSLDVSRSGPSALLEIHRP
jgi:N-acetylglucosamine kinase-like BadF-type ATPase